MRPVLRLFALLLWLLPQALAAQGAPWAEAEVIRSEGARIERLMLRPPTEALRDEIAARLADVGAAWDTARAGYGAGAATDAIDAALAAYAQAVRAGAAPEAARARQRLWAGLIGAAGDHALAALAAGDADAAGSWLNIRDYARNSGATGATRAVAALKAGTMTPETARAEVEGELLTIAAGALREAVTAARADLAAGNAVLLAGDLGRAEGMLAILSDNLAARLGAPARDALAEALAQVPQTGAAALDALDEGLRGYAPVALSPEETLRRARLMRRFTALVLFDYRIGVRDGEIAIPLDYHEAITFRTRAAMLLPEVAPGMADAAGAARLHDIYAQMEPMIADRVDPDLLQPLGDEALAIIDRSFGAEVAQGGYDLAVASIPEVLDRLAAAASAGDREGAEAARLEAYAWFDPDIEQRLMPRAPTLALRLEALFWEGSASAPGLARLIATQAPEAQVAGGIAALTAALDQARAVIETPLSPVTAALQSGGIIFREGLEAVLILAALVAALRAEGVAPRRYRLPLAAGVAAALVFSVALWAAARWVITVSTLAREALEGGTALLAAIVLIWLTLGLTARGGHVATLRRRVAAGVSGTGLGVLAFFVVFREGFETILFYEAMLVDAPPAGVLAGLTAGIVAVLFIGRAVLLAGRRLPLRLLFRVTGALLAVLAVMLTGAGVRGLQTAALIGATPVAWFPESYTLQLWLGLYPVAETLAAQGAVVALFLVAWLVRRRAARKVAVGRGAGRRTRAGQPGEET
ncbi:MAG: FTR1 family protein [Rubellimicrobium sp.]|nr:FTR1 family protein [Rubellimicrobium sp.]